MNPQRVLTYRGTVYPWHCDHVGHMNVMWFVGKFDEATWHLFHAIGLGPTRLRDTGRGMAAVDQRLNYTRELRAGAVVSVTSVIDEVHERKIRFTHEMRDDDAGEVAATATILGVHLDTTARRACPLPSDVIERARALLARAT